MVGGVLWGGNTCVAGFKVLIVLGIVIFGKVLLGVWRGVFWVGVVRNECAPYGAR